MDLRQIPAVARCYGCWLTILDLDLCGHHATWTALVMQDQTSAVLRASHLLLRITMKRNELPLVPFDPLVNNDTSTYALLIAGGTSLDLRPVGTQDLPQVSFLVTSLVGT
jgi:hypothetical protein